MRLSVAAALVCAAFASAQNSTSNSTTNSTSYASGLLAALGASGLTTLTTLAAGNAAVLLPLLQTGNHTVFAPTDAAFAAAGNLSTTLLGETILYHIFAGSFNSSNLNSTHDTIIRSALNTSDLVNLPGGQGQVAPIQANGSAVTVFPGTANAVTSTANATYQNLQIYVVDKVLPVPQNLTATLAATSSLSSLTGLIQQYVPTVAPLLANQKGITIFAPNNAAIAAGASVLAQVASNVSVVETILLNHILNGTVLYGSQLQGTANVTSSSGESLAFTTNANGTFVTSGNFTATVIQSDIIIKNGVVHIIDNILANTASNPSAAASAASSAISAGSSATAAPTGAVTSGPGAPAATTSKPAGASRMMEASAALLLGAGLIAIFA